MGVHTCHCLFRVEAGPGVGLGHLSRCLALAGWLKGAGAECGFVMTDPDQNVTERVARQGFKLLHRDPEEAAGSDPDAKKLALAAHKHGAGWLIVDGYGFGPRYFQTLRANSSALILAVDDYQGKVEADLILNQNLGVDEGLYDRAGAELLVGPDYCLLPPGFGQGRERVKENGRVQLLVTLGGADPAGLTSRVVRTLAGLADIRADVVVGPFSQFLKGAVRGASATMEFHQSPGSLVPLILRADLAIMSLGVTTWEMAALGLPMVMLPVHPAQMPTAQWLEENGYATLGMELGNFEEERFLETVMGLLRNPQELERQSRGLKTLVDGRGGARVTAAMDRIRSSRS